MFAAYIIYTLPGEGGTQFRFGSACVNLVPKQKRGKGTLNTRETRHETHETQEKLVDELNGKETRTEVD